jgi:ABC-type antimicrobial peptide transport system permease subunit
MNVWPYFSLGWEHIISLYATDHQLFILTLLVGKTLRDHRHLLILVTIFTIGHSMTLVLAAGGYLQISTYWVELFIPISIFLTAFYQWKIGFNSDSQKKFSILVAMAGFFGLFHGLGFAKTLESILGRSESILMPLFGFNVGLEAGQLFFLFLILIFQELILLIPGFKAEYWHRLVMTIAIFGSGWMVADRI